MINKKNVTLSRQFVEAGSLPQPLEPENLDPYTAIRSGQNSHTEDAAAGWEYGFNLFVFVFLFCLIILIKQNQKMSLICLCEQS